MVHLRPGNAGSNTATDHITVTKQALAQLPGKNPRPGRKVLVRADGAGGTKDFTAWLTGRRVSFSVGFTLPLDTSTLYQQVPDWVWVPALNADGQAREGADLADFTGLLNLTGWPAGMRVIVRRERPHPGAQLRFDDVDGYRLTALATNTTLGTLQQLELRHRQTGPLRRPDPDRERHRPGQPPVAGVRPEPDLVPDRRAGLRVAGLERDAGPGRS